MQIFVDTFTKIFHKRKKINENMSELSPIWLVMVNNYIVNEVLTSFNL